MSTQLICICPACGYIGRQQVSNAGFHLPPTGGDYDWVEAEAQAACPTCQHSYEVRVRVDLDTGNISKLVYAPFPDLQEFECYVFAYTIMATAVEWIIAIIHLEKNLEAMEFWMKSKNYQGLQMDRKCLKLTSKGYFDLQGNQIPSFSSRLSFH